MYVSENYELYSKTRIERSNLVTLKTDVLRKVAFDLRFRIKDSDLERPVLAQRRWLECTLLLI